MGWGGEWRGGERESTISTDSNCLQRGPGHRPDLPGLQQQRVRPRLPPHLTGPRLPAANRRDPHAPTTALRRDHVHGKECGEKYLLSADMSTKGADPLSANFRDKKKFPTML